MVGFTLLPALCMSTAVTYLSTFVVDQFEEGYPALQVLCGCLVVAMFVICFVKQDLRRRNAEKIVEEREEAEEEITED